MTRINMPSPPSSLTPPNRLHDDEPNRAQFQPTIKRQENSQSPLSHDARQSPGAQKLNPAQGFIDKSADLAAKARIAINTPLFGTGSVALAGTTAKRQGAKVPAPVNAASTLFTKAGVPMRAAELPFRTLTTIKAVKDQNAGDATVSTAKLAATATELVSDALTVVTGPSNGPAVKILSVPFERGHPLRTNNFSMEPLRPAPPSATPGQATTPAPSQSASAHAPFTRGGPSRTPVRLNAPPPPRLPAPQLPSHSIPASPSTLSTTLSRVSNIAFAAGSLPDIYFGTKQAIEEREALGKTQGAFFAGAGILGAGSGIAGTASTFGAATAGTASTALAAGSLGLAAVGFAMATIPAIHGRDNKNRAIKLYNDASHELRQLDETDKQLSNRVNDDLKPSLQKLAERYGVETGTVWLNNNSADFLNQVNSPNNTASGQWKPDADGKVWSNFSDAYISIGGTPHQDEVVLDLPAEKGGIRPTAADFTLNVSGDNSPEKNPTLLKGLAAESERYDNEGWSGSAAQPTVSKHYGYKTSSWGQHWETSIPLAIDAGPHYLSHAVSDEGRDTVVLINDTSIERPEKPAPQSGYSEGALFAHDGKDGERLTAKQVATLVLAGKPATIGDTFNVADSAEKAEENAYREAAYPVKDGASYIRSPDAFTRVIKTHPEKRTVVSLQNVTQPTRLALQNERDIVDVPGALGEHVTISLPPLPAGKVDERRLGIADEQVKPILKEQSVHATMSGKKAIHASTYTLGNGTTITVQATDPMSIERFMDNVS